MNAAYSLNTSPLSWVSLPVMARFGSDYKRIDDTDIAHETNGGARWVYRLFSRDIWVLEFRFTEAQLVAFRTLHDAVDGQVNPFWFRLSHVSPALVLFCRKESGFAPRMLTTPSSDRIYDYTLTLTEEISAIEVGA